MSELIEIPKIPDARGNLSFIENGDRLPFVMERCYWIYDVPGGEVRHGHAFRRQHEMIVALAGSFDVVLDDGNGSQRYHLARSYYGLYVPPMTWRMIDNFSTCSVAMVLSSTTYEADDYIEDYDQFISELSNAEIPALTHNSARVSFPAPIKTRGHSVSSINHCGIIELPRHRHPNGSLSVVENTRGCPFEIKRVFYLYDVPGDSERGGHSHYEAKELIVAVSGSFDVTLDDGHSQHTFTLNRPYRALYVEEGIWRSLGNFSSGSVCLVLTSHVYDPADYVRDYSLFKQLTAHKI